MSEQASIGAAMIAGVGCGIYPNMEAACNAIVRISPEPIRPIAENSEIYTDLYGVFGLLYKNNANLSQ